MQTTPLQSQTSNRQTSVLAGRLQAWCVNLLSIPADAYQLGAVVGKGAIAHAGDVVLTPDVMLVADAGQITAEEIVGAPALAIDLIDAALPEAQRVALVQQYAAAGVQEYWQIEADTACPLLYQRNTRGSYDRIASDAAGIYYSCLEELFFPVLWFTDQPNLWTMMQYWGMIQDLPQE